MVFSREFDEFGQKLKSAAVHFNYVHNGFIFKLPIYCYNKKESTPGLVMTSLMFGALNCVAYLGLRY